MKDRQNGTFELDDLPFFMNLTFLCKQMKMKILVKWWKSAFVKVRILKPPCLRELLVDISYLSNADF